MNVSKLFEKIKDWHRERETIRELLTYSDRELGDIGLRRADVVLAVKHGTRAD